MTQDTIKILCVYPYTLLDLHWPSWILLDVIALAQQMTFVPDRFFELGTKVIFWGDVHNVMYAYLVMHIFIHQPCLQARRKNWAGPVEEANISSLS